MNKRNGEQVFCELPDSTICALPTWMFSADCARFTVGPPLIHVEALRELRDVLSAWQSTSSWDKASLKQSPREVVRETTRQSDHVGTVASAAPHRVQGGDVRRQAEGTCSGAGGATHQRYTRKPGDKNKRRQR